MKKSWMLSAAALTLLAGCCGNPAAPDAAASPAESAEPAAPAARTLDPALNGKWLLVRLTAPEAAKLRQPEGVELEFKDGRAAGCAGVNRFFGSASTEGDRLLLGRMGTTMMAGPGLEYETLVLQAFGRTDRYRIRDGRLELLNGDDLLAVFRRAAE